VPCIGRSQALALLAAGVAATVLNGLGGILILDLPDVDASGAEIRQYAAAHHGRLIAASIAWGLGTTATLMFVVALRRLLLSVRDAESVLTSMGAAGGLAVVAFLYVSFGLLATLAFRAPTDASTARMLLDIMFVLLAFAGFPTALWCFFVSVQMLKDGVGRAWVSWLGLFSAAVHLVAAAALAESGFLSPSGPFAFIAPLAISAWIAAITLVAAGLVYNGPLAWTLRRAFVDRRL
jgi:hypothetical protein